MVLTYCMILLVAFLGCAWIYVRAAERQAVRRDRQVEADARVIAPSAASDTRRIGFEMYELLGDAVADPLYRQTDEFEERARTFRARWRGDSS